MDNAELIQKITEVVMKQMAAEENCCREPKDKKIPLGISNRHVHLSDQDLVRLFGENAELTKFKDLSQPGQFACNEKVTLVGLKGVIENVRVLGPTRNQTQVEISVSDCVKLGTKAPIRDSGDLEGSAGLTLVGPSGSVTLNQGCIIAARHIHMHPSDASYFGVKDKDKVNVKCVSSRGIIFLEVLIRVSEKYSLEMHVDRDEANAASLRDNDSVQIIENC